MILYYAFPVCVAGAAVALGALCRGKPGRFLGWWLLSSVVLGLGGLFIPWKMSDGRHHGLGTPIPCEIWERIDNGVYVDFPGAAATVFNPLAVFALGAAAWALASFVLRRLS